MLTTVTSKGQVTIPGKIRRRFGVTAGDKVIFNDHQGESGLVGLRFLKKGSIMELYGALRSKKEYRPIEEVREIVARDIARHYGLKK